MPARPSERVLAAGLKAAHRPEPLETRQALARLEARMFRAPQAAVHIDRYRLDGVLGSGGGGLVFAGHDPQLDRAVAIKVLRRAGDGDKGRARLIREAQAIARVSHPNVVQVFDVGTFDPSALPEDAQGSRDRNGPSGDAVYVVMERIEGEDLRTWLRRPRSWRSILRAFVQAGRGLAAAHAAGVIHRDFKPSNAMIRPDDTVVVLDFGVARPVDDAPSTNPQWERASSRSASSSNRLTATGWILGTPAYMSPEQARDDRTDARTDQFSFCVALYEALYGRLPFENTSAATLAAARERGDIVPPPLSADAPPWLVPLLSRGLSADPRQRHPSMTVLVDALARTGRRRWGFALALAIPVVGLALTAAMTRREPGCSDRDHDVAVAWNDAVRGRLGRAYERTGLSYAAAVWQRSAVAVDAWSAAHHAAYATACASGAETTPEAFDARMTCLSSNADSLVAVLGVLSEASEESVRSSLAAIGSLPRSDACLEIGAEPRFETDPAFAPLRERLARARANTIAGDHRNARRWAEGAVAVADTSGEPRAQARAHHQLARALNRAGEYTDAAVAADAAYWYAVSGDDYDVAAAAALTMVRLGKVTGRNPDATARWVRDAEAALQRTDADADAEGWAELWEARGTFLSNQGQIEDARADLERALAARQRLAKPGDARIGSLYVALGNTYEDPATAQRSFMRAREALEDAVGPDHPDIASVIHSLGSSYHIAGQLERARVAYLEAIEHRDRSMGEGHPYTALTLTNLGALELDLGEPRLAAGHLRRARAIIADKFGPDSVYLPPTLSHLGAAYLQMKQYDRARTVLERSLALAIDLSGPNSARAADPSVQLAELDLATGDPEAALRRLEPALAILDQGNPHIARLTQARFGLARALWRTGGDRERAVALATRVRDDLRSGAASRGARLRDVRRWLRAPR